MPMVRVNEATHKLLQLIASENKETMQDIISHSVEEYRRKKLLEETNKAYSILKENKEDWAEEVRERAEWDQVLLDDLDKDDEEVPEL